MSINFIVRRIMWVINVQMLQHHNMHHSIATLVGRNRRLIFKAGGAQSWRQHNLTSPPYHLTTGSPPPCLTTYLTTILPQLKPCITPTPQCFNPHNLNNRITCYPTSPQLFTTTTNKLPLHHLYLTLTEMLLLTVR